MTATQYKPFLMVVKRRANVCAPTNRAPNCPIHHDKELEGEKATWGKKRRPKTARNTARLQLLEGGGGGAR